MRGVFQVRGEMSDSSRLTQPSTQGRRVRRGVPLRRFTDLAAAPQQTVLRALASGGSEKSELQQKAKAGMNGNTAAHVCSTGCLRRSTVLNLKSRMASLSAANPQPQQVTSVANRRQ